MKKILCPVDFSDAALNACEYGANLATHFNATLYLMQVSLVPSLQELAEVNAGFTPDTEKRLKFTKEKLNVLCESIQDEFKIDCQAIVTHESFSLVTALKKAIGKYQFDLIVMGTNGADSLKQLFFGTNSYNLAKSTKCPFIMIPEDASFNPFNQIVYASDFEMDDIRVLQNLEKITKQFKPEITVLHIHKKTTPKRQEEFDAFKNMLGHSLSDNANIEYHELEGAVPALGIDRYMTNTNSDLLVLLTGQYNFLEKIFHFSVTKDISLKASYPVLIYHMDQMIS